MTLKTTVGQLMVNEALPAALRDHARELDAKSIGKLLQTVAENHPEEYAETLKRLHGVGHRAAFASGGMSFGIEHLKKAKAARLMEQQLRARSKAIYRDPALTDEQKDEKLVEMLLGSHKALEDAVMKEATEGDNPLARQVLSGAKGKAMNLKSLLGMDLLYVDHRDRPIPIPILRSYSQGLTPVEYFAGSFGTRKGLIDLKMATPDAGFLSKQLVQAGHRLVVTDHDHPEWDGSLRGLPVDTEDPDNVGALLAHDVGGYKRGTVINSRIAADLAAQGQDKILVRSPATFGSPDGGLYAADVGVRERGRLPYRGDFVGIAAAQALAEPLAQAAISSKHSGGVAGASKAVGGYKLINQFVQVPKTFQGGAAHSKLDGRVQSVEPAPQGGHYVTVSGERHYVGQGYGLKVKPGDVVEAGDVLSEGWPNPSEIVRHKGVGEGRAYLIDSLRSAYKDAGIGAHRRNIELVARSLIDHVRVTEPYGDHLPDDVIPYNRLEHQYEPREGHLVADVARAKDMYLEKPVLHYSIGTRVRPSVVKNLNRFGVKQVTVHADPPPFEPEMIRGMENLAHDPDWMTRFLGSYLQKNLIKGVARGAKSDELGTSYVPALARGQQFGQAGLTQGWKSPDGPGATKPVTVPMGARDLTTPSSAPSWRPVEAAKPTSLFKAAAGLQPLKPLTPQQPQQPLAQPQPLKPPAPQAPASTQPPRPTPPPAPVTPPTPPPPPPAPQQGIPLPPSQPAAQQPTAQPAPQPEASQVRVRYTPPQQPAQPQFDLAGMVNSLRGSDPQVVARLMTGPGRPLLEALGPSLGLPGIMTLMHYFSNKPGETDYSQVFSPGSRQPTSQPSA